MNKKSNALTIEVTFSAKDLEEIAEEVLNANMYDWHDKKALKQMGYTESSIVSSLACDTQFRTQVKKALLRELEYLSLEESIHPQDVKFLKTFMDSYNDYFKAYAESEEARQEEAQADQKAIDRLKAKGYTVSKKK